MEQYCWKKRNLKKKNHLTVGTSTKSERKITSLLGQVQNPKEKLNNEAKSISITQSDMEKY